ncbi:MAG: ATP-binding cassette domain-containing protein [Alphaproteobacteria bacterium]|nr:ATP-binding cassette domain-containing protein [Alphaproteobacteria bacterium]
MSGLGASFEVRRGFRLKAEFAVAAGTTVVFGASGVGKTTLLNVIAGLVEPEVGKIVLDGRTLLDRGAGVCLPPEERKAGYVPQTLGLFPHKTSLENVAFGAKSAEYAREWLERMHVSHRRDAYPGSLSGGERQRVALARALATDPQVLLLDEPFSALDIGIKYRLAEELKSSWAATPIPVLMVTHDLGEALTLGDYVLELEAGEIVRRGPPAEVLGPRREELLRRWQEIRAETTNP